MCIWVLIELELIKKNYTFLKLVSLCSVMHYNVCSLCNHRLLQFSANESQTCRSYFGHTEDVNV